MIHNYNHFVSGILKNKDIDPNNSDYKKGVIVFKQVEMMIEKELTYYQINSESALNSEVLYYVNIFKSNTVTEFINRIGFEKIDIVVNQSINKYQSHLKDITGIIKFPNNLFVENILQNNFEYLNENLINDLMFVFKFFVFNQIYELKFKEKA